jgi:hypothetical protein
MDAVVSGPPTIGQVHDLVISGRYERGLKSGVVNIQGRMVPCYDMRPKESAMSAIPEAFTAIENSSNLKEVAHQDDTLYVRFLSGDATWKYTGVPASVFDEMMAAPSKGSYFSRNIKGNSAYKAEKLEFGAAPV